jgi:hypothetical protein
MARQHAKLMKTWINFLALTSSSREVHRATPEEATHNQVGMARCGARAAVSGARSAVIRALYERSFSPLNAGWDGAARHPYLPRELRPSPNPLFPLMKSANLVLSFAV